MLYVFCVLFIWILLEVMIKVIWKLPERTGIPDNKFSWNVRLDGIMDILDMIVLDPGYTIVSKLNTVLYGIPTTADGKILEIGKIAKLEEQIIKLHRIMIFNRETTFLYDWLKIVVRRQNICIFWL